MKQIGGYNRCACGRFRSPDTRPFPDATTGRQRKCGDSVWPAPPRSPAELARIVLSTNAELIGLDGVLRTLHRRVVKRSIGGWHVIFNQRLFGHRVHRAYVTVHMNRDRQV